MIFSSLLFPDSTVFGGEGETSKSRRLILLISAGWLPPCIGPSGAFLGLGSSVCFRLLTFSRVAPTSGPRFLHLKTHRLFHLRDRCLHCDRPDICRHFPRDGYNHFVPMFTTGSKPVEPLTKPNLGFPADGLNLLGYQLKSVL